MAAAAGGSRIKLFERGGERIDIAGRHQQSGCSVNHDDFGGAGARRHQGRARRHRLEQRQTETFLA
jgi:hypothetical protein